MHCGVTVKAGKTTWVPQGQAPILEYFCFGTKCLPHILGTRETEILSYSGVFCSIHMYQMGWTFEYLQYQSLAVTALKTKGS